MGVLTAIGTLTKTFSVVFGNKRIWMGTVVLGDGVGSTWPEAGLTLSASSFGLDTIEHVVINGGTLFYSYNGSVIHAYTGAATTGADKVMVVATAAVPVSDTVNLLVIGTGGSNV